MPRKARKNLESMYLHVMIQGNSKEYIFEQGKYKEKYLELIKKYKEEFNIEIFAYCIMGNHAHLLLHVNTIGEVSSFMHKINCIYATYYNKSENRVGHVFRNRYKSEAISDAKYLNNCIKYIHNNPVKTNLVKFPLEYKYSSYKNYYYKSELNENIKKLVDFDYIINNFKKVENIFIDIDENTKYIMKEFKDFVIKKDISIEEKIIKIEDLKKKYNIKYKESCRLLNISERTFRRKKVAVYKASQNGQGGRNEI